MKLSIETFDNKGIIVYLDCPCFQLMISLTIKVYNVLIVPVILPSILLSQKKPFGPCWITSLLVKKQDKEVFCFNL